jgi:hypothetical protein
MCGNAGTRPCLKARSCGLVMRLAVPSRRAIDVGCRLPIGADTRATRERAAAEQNRQASGEIEGRRRILYLGTLLRSEGRHQ